MGLKFFFIAIISFASLYQNASAQVYNLLTDKARQLDIIRSDANLLERNLFSFRNELKSRYDSLQQYNRELNFLGELLRNVSESSLNPEEKLILQNLEIENISDKISELKDKFAQKVIWLYKNGPNYKDKSLLSSASLNEFYIRLKYLDKISELRKSNFNRIRENQELLEEKKKILSLSFFQRKNYIYTKTAAQKTLIEKKIIEEQRISFLENQIENLTRQIEHKAAEIKNIESFFNRRTENFEIRLNNVPDYDNLPFSSLKGKLILPVISTDIVNDYGLYYNRLHKNPAFNSFVEVSISKGSDVICVADGIVKEIVTLPSLENVIIIDHGEGFKTVYAIIDSLNVSEGQIVNAGQIIAKTSENLEGQLFHFELWHNNSPLDPKAWIKKNADR